MATPTAAHVNGPALTGRTGPKPIAALAALSLAQLMLVLDVSVVNVALPDMGAGLGLGRSALTWALTAYSMVFGGTMLLGGRLGDQFGARRMMMTGMAVFTAASAVSGFAGGEAVLIAGRLLQGVGAALMSPSALSLITTMFTGAARTRALGAPAWPRAGTARRCWWPACRLPR